MEMELGDMQMRLRNLEQKVDAQATKINIQTAQIEFLLKLADNYDRTFKLHKEFILGIVNVLNLTEEERKYADKFRAM